MASLNDEPGGSEVLRKIVHMGMGLFALLLRVLQPWQAALAAAAALAHNLWIMPRLWGRKVYRAAEIRRGLPVAVMVYPFSVLLLILLYGTRMFIAAGAWAVMAFGDGLAGIVGRAVGRIRYPWNRKKTLEGTLGFFIGGVAGAAALMYWTTRGVVPKGWTAEPALFFLGVPAAVVALTGLLETLDLRLDDNFTVPMAAGFLFYMAYETRFVHGLPVHLSGTAWLLALAVTLAPALVFLGVGWVDVSGAVTGGLVGWLTLGAGSWPAFVLLFAFFFLGSLATRMGRETKRARGIAESGRRSSANVLAKCGPQTLVIVWWALAPDSLRVPIALAYITGYTAAAMDTISSEIGKWLGRRAFLWWRLRAVPPGTEGAISLEGTVAGWFGAAILLAPAWVLYRPWLTPARAAIVLASAWAANLLESLLGAWLQPRGLASNEEINALLVTAAMLLAFLVFRIPGFA